MKSITPDDEQKDRPKHVEWYSLNLKIVHLVGFTYLLTYSMEQSPSWEANQQTCFTIDIYGDARSHERQIAQTI
jgi:hypothetical protein